jgi:ribosomal protein S18 acetylase RimI-like enzyme
MNSGSISYQIKTAGKEQIYSHLMECNDSFVPPLTERVNIAEYSQKLYEKAVTFEAWSNNKLIGLIAAYFDDTNSSSFITDVSIIKKYMKLGIATNLLNMCITYTREKKIKEIKLEVHKDNLPAITFYNKFDFAKTDTKEDSLVMKLAI